MTSYRDSKGNHILKEDFLNTSERQMNASFCKLFESVTQIYLNKRYTEINCLFEILQK